MRGPVWELWLAAGVLGLCVGSFLNVVIYRVPEKLSIARPGSHCPKCNQQLSTLDLVPVLSWVALRGRCRYCKAPVSAQYPLVELLNAALWVLVLWRFGPDLLAVAWMLMASVLLALTAIDIERMKLPRQIIWWGGIPAAVVAAAAVAYHADWVRMGWAALAAVVLGGAFMGIALLVRGGMGAGDVRLTFVLGWMLGLLAAIDVAWAIALSFGLAVLVGVPLTLASGKGRKAKIPMGPFLAVGFLATALAVAPVHL